MSPYVFECTKLPSPIRPIEQITVRPPFQDGDPRLFPMLVSVMAKMAALAKRFQITEPVVAGIMIKMCRRQDDLGALEGVVSVVALDRPPLPVPPDRLIA